METRSNGQLLSAWRNGDSGAFEALVGRYQAPLLRHARSLLGERSGHEDVVQEAFLRLAQSPPQLSAEGDARAEEALLASWLHKVTRNLSMDALRSDARRRRREEEAATKEATPGGLSRVDENDTREAVERGLSRLPDDQREVLALRLFGERSYREIAEITGKKIGTVGWLISVGLKSLGEELAPLLAIQPVPTRRGSGDAQVGFLHGEL